MTGQDESTATGDHAILPPASVETDPRETAGASAPAKRRRLVDLAPLTASPVFARLWIGNAISGIGCR